MKPPRYTTHVRLDTKSDGTKRMAICSIKDMDCLAGCKGKVTYLHKMSKGKYKELGSFAFNGKWPMKGKNNEG